MGMDRILVGVDFRPPALAAARWTARQFADAIEIELAHVTPVHDGVRAGPSLRDALIGLASGLGPAPITSEVLIGHRAARLVERARSVNADLVVLGRSTVDGIRGRTIERLVRQLDVPVLAVGCGVESRPRHVLVAVDSSAMELAVAEWGRVLARHFGAQLTLLHVVPEAVDPIRRWLMRAWLKDLACDADALVWTNADAGTGILEAIATEGADLLVIGRNGADALGVEEIGTATGIVLRRAQIPIMVVPHAEAWPSQAGGRSDSGSLAFASSNAFLGDHISRGPSKRS